MSQNQWITIRAKIKKENYLELDKYSKNVGITTSAYIRSLIETNRPAEVSLKKAGINIFRFNPLEDNFYWEIKFDDESKSVIAEELSNEFLENLKNSIEKALTNRREHIKKRLNESVVIPTRFNKLKGSGHNVKA